VNSGNYVVTPGKWYRVEFLLKANSGSATQSNWKGTPDGTIEWRVNGTLVGSYTNVRTGPRMTMEGVSVYATPVRDGQTTGPSSAESIERVDDIRIMAPGPGTVHDLSVIQTFSNAVMLHFTEVDDGYGDPATYQVRYAPSPIAWGSAIDVPGNSNGSSSVLSCKAPFPGTGTGAASCYVVGLSPGTRYDFQIAAYHGTLNQNAVFGGLSNIASTTTAATATDIGQSRILVAGQPPGSDTRTTAVLSIDPPDGASGQPIRYDIRLTTGTMDWGSAQGVTRGDCTDFTAPHPDGLAPPTVHCTVQGLSPGTHYQFQLIPYRGTLNKDAVYGPLSNVTETTTSP
jgi:hypothetical protein